MLEGPRGDLGGCWGGFQGTLGGLRTPRSTSVMFPGLFEAGGAVGEWAAVKWGGRGGVEGGLGGPQEVLKGHRGDLGGHWGRFRGLWGVLWGIGRLGGGVRVVLDLIWEGSEGSQGARGGGSEEF